MVGESRSTQTFAPFNTVGDTDAHSGRKHHLAGSLSCFVLA
jgi:hypothetical protein